MAIDVNTNSNEEITINVETNPVESVINVSSRLPQAESIETVPLFGPEGPQGPQGEKGDTGNGIEEIVKTSTEGLVDTYTIYYTDGTTWNYEVKNGTTYNAGQGIDLTNNFISVKFSEVVSTSTTVNGQALSSNISLTASDVNALPDTTTINDLTTTAQQNALNSGATSTNIGQIATNTSNINSLTLTVDSNYNTLNGRITSEVTALNNTIGQETTNRQNADNNLQSQIDAITSSSDVFDIVGTYADLQAYDITIVPVNDIIKVLVDSTHSNSATYYRCTLVNGVKTWVYIGAEGAYYTKSEADNKFVEQTTTVNGKALSTNITLSASDVGALPSSTVIGSGVLTIQKNGSNIDTFSANATSNKSINITVPTDTNDLTNGAGYITGITSSDVTTALGYTPYNSSNPSGYITGITSSDVTTALGYTPYNSSNPSGYQANVIESIKVNGTAQTVTSKAVDISVPTDTSDLTNGAGYITGITSSDVTTALGYTPYDSTNPNGYTSNTGTVTSVNNVQPVNGNVTLNIPTKVSDLTDDTATNPIDKADTLTGLTASISELNIMDGVTVTASQINSVTSKLDGFSLMFAGAWSGGVHAVNFATVDYTDCNSENGVFIKFSMVNSHGNGQAGRFLQDVVLNVKHTGEVATTLYRFFAVPIDQSSSEYYGSHYYGDVFWVNDTTNKIVRFYVLMHQYSYTSQSPYFRLNASTKGVITQSTGVGASEYSSGTRVWATVNWYETDQTYSATSPKPQSGVAVASAISTKQNEITSSNKLSASLVSGLANVATSGNYNDLSNTPSIPTVEEYTANEVDTLWNSI